MKRTCSRRHVVVWVAIGLLITLSTSQPKLIRSTYFIPTKDNDSQQSSPSAKQEASLVDNNISRPTIPSNNTTLPVTLKKTVEDTTSSSSLSSLARRKECKPGSNQPLQQVSSFSNYANASSYWDYPKTIPKTMDVVCEFNKDRPSAMHFPHAMQQFYGCFAMWQEYPNNRPVLLLSPQVEKRMKRNAFLGGVFQLFRSLKVEVVGTKAYAERKQNGSNQEPQKLDVPGGYILNHANKLKDAVGREFQLRNDSAHSCRNDKPRIGILNRRVSAGRSILNAELVATAIQNQSHNNSVLVEHFEGLDFAEQVSFFRSVDVLIAPHGAQLTGVAFLDAPCSHLVELFPKGYAIPNFFGSLAINSGTNYSYLYMSDNSYQNEQAVNFQERKHARSMNLCPSLELMTSIVGDLSRDWKQCCSS